MNERDLERFIMALYTHGFSAEFIKMRLEMILLEMRIGLNQGNKRYHGTGIKTHGVRPG